MIDSATIKQRDATIDIMRSIGILLVFTVHFLSWNHTVIWALSNKASNIKDYGFAFGGNTEAGFIERL